MTITKKISSDDFLVLRQQREGHFFDFKGKKIKPSKLSRTISAFANSSGGEIMIGMEEIEGVSGSEVHWDGFTDEEDANGFLQMIHDIDPIGNNFSVQFLASDEQPGRLLHVIVSKTRVILESTDGKTYIRKGAQNLPLAGDAIERLKYDKGISSWEDEAINSPHTEISNSNTVIEFMLETVPTSEPVDWLRKQQLIVADRPTVAGVLLFSDLPQSLLPKRSAVKILRYQTKDDAERDYLAGNPETIEGPIYSLIYDSVSRVREILEGIEKIGPKGLEKISYPEDALHELVTNAILHRDYSIPSDIQIRIFDNRVEIESPGKLPGHVTIENIAKTQFARNAKLVRLVNKFSDPPNKDVGEGINTAFEAMEKLRLKKPEFEETAAGFLVTLKHEALASPEVMVLEYLMTNEEITNQQARELTGIKSENSMKNVFYRLRDAKEIEQSPKLTGKKHSWRKVRLHYEEGLTVERLTEKEPSLPVS